MNKKKLIRENFRTQVFTRDNHKCKVCNSCAARELDAHHITNRNKMPNGGYVKENGISLCPRCHIRAELSMSTADDRTYFVGYEPQDLYHRIGSSLELATEKSKLL